MLEPDRTRRARDAPEPAEMFYGPVYGEFGHELAACALARKTAHKYERVTVCSRPGMSALYMDFADEFIAHDITCVGNCSRATSSTQPSAKLLASFIPPDRDFRVVEPMSMNTNNANRLLAEQGEYVIYGTVRADYEHAVVIHARNRPHVAQRNWPIAKWHALARWLKTVGRVERIICIGTREQALIVEGAADMRGTPLGIQMDVLRSARLAIGPSSGPMHLAQHCGCPVVVWCGGPEREGVAERYRTTWNPHRARAQAWARGSWQSAVNTVMRHAEILLAETARKRRPALLPVVEAMRLHVCQAMTYDWILRDLANVELSGKQVLDFGPNGYPLIGELARRGGTASWVDRNDAVKAKMQAIAKRMNVRLERLGEPRRATYDIIIASNAIQHNKETAPLYAMLLGALAPGGRLYLAEALSDGPARWDGKRKDPCWYRPLAAIRNEWRTAGLRPEKEAFLRYRFAAQLADEMGEWCDEKRATRVVARLSASGVGI